MEEIEKKKRIFIIGAVVILAILLLGFFFYTRQKGTEEKRKIIEKSMPKLPTKQEIIQGLSVPKTPGTPKVTEAQKKAILKSLSAPAKTKTTITDKQKQDILHSLSL